MATLAESFMADLADLSDDSASSDDEQRQEPADAIDGEDLLVRAAQVFSCVLATAELGAAQLGAASRMLGAIRCAWSRRMRLTA